MTIEEGIRAFLTGSPYPLAIEGRVWHARAPQSPTAPYLVFTRIAVSPRLSHGGPVRTIQRLFQFSLWASSQSEAISIADQLRRMLNGYRGLMGDVQVKACRWSSESFLYDDTVRLFQVTLDFEIDYIEQ